MTRRSRIIPVLLFPVLLTGAPLFGALNGGNSFETLSLTFNARFFGLAGAGTALVDDVNACLMNAARLTEIAGLEFGASVSSHFAGSLGGQASFAYPMPFGVFGMSLVYFNYGRAELRTGDTALPDAVWSPSDILATVSFGNRLGRTFSFGLNLKYLQEALTPDETFFGFAADLHSALKDALIPGLDLALTVNNLGAITRQEFRENNLPISVVLGASYPLELEFPAAGIYDIKPCLDLELTSDLRPRVLFGSEFCWYHVTGDLDVTARLGYAWPSDPGPLTGFRLGAGVDFRNFDLAYAIGWMDDLGFIHRVSLVFKLKTPPPRRYVESISRHRLDRDLKEFNKAFSNSQRTNQGQVRPPPKTEEPPPPNEQKKPAENDEFDFEE